MAFTLPSSIATAPWHCASAASGSGHHVQGSDVDHAMSCNRLSGARSRRHDQWKEALCRVTSRAGCDCYSEPSYNTVGTAAAGRQGARADIDASLPRPHGRILLDISMTHPRCSSYVAVASRSPGAAAAKRDSDKYRSHAGHQHPGHTFVPATVETYGYLGKPLTRYLNHLSQVAETRSTGGLTKGSFLASAFRELSVALVQSQGHVYRSCASLMARASGRHPVPGARVSTLD